MGFFEEQQVLACIHRLESAPDVLKEHWSLPPAEARFLSMLATLQGAKRMLEVGTSIGYSALWLGLAALETQGQVETVEASEERLSKAKAHVETAGLTHRITFYHGDACRVLADLVSQQPEAYDFIFLDANKSQYGDYFRYSEQLLMPGGLLVADNTRSHRSKMLNFIETITSSSAWQVSDLETPNGLLVARKRGRDAIQYPW